MDVAAGGFPGGLESSGSSRSMRMPPSSMSMSPKIRGTISAGREFAGSLAGTFMCVCVFVCVCICVCVGVCMCLYVKETEKEREREREREKVLFVLHGLRQTRGKGRSHTLCSQRLCRRLPQTYMQKATPNSNTELGCT